MTKTSVSKSASKKDDLFVKKEYIPQKPVKKKELSLPKKLMGAGRKRQKVKFP